VRRISEIFCDLVDLNWKIHCVEHVKMLEFMVGETMNDTLVAEMDGKMRIYSEKRKAAFNEMNLALADIIKKRKYGFKV
jgi:hypothetical protein